MSALTAWTGTEELSVSGELLDIGAVSRVERIPSGYASVSAMLAGGPFYVAHRGGSKSYPEHSLYAYTESVRRGAGALELSLAHTVDGKWFGQHDQTLARTAVVDVNPQTLTWDEVRRIPIRGALTGTGSGPDRPHMLAEELIAAYGETHVLFLDPKYVQQSHRAEFWDLVESVPDARSRVVVKYHQSNVSLGRDARSRGFTSWGYFYEGELDADLATNADAWSILGLEYSASESAWARVKALGKPVMGHIAPNLAAVETALSKGADGVMVAGVADGVPAADTTAHLS